MATAKLSYTVESVSFALDRAVQRGDLRSWSIGYTGHAHARVFFEAINSTGDDPGRMTLSEAHAFVFGLWSARLAMGYVRE